MARSTHQSRTARRHRKRKANKRRLMDALTRAKIRMAGKVKSCWECGLTLGETDPRREDFNEGEAQCIRCVSNFILHPRRPQDHPGCAVARWMREWVRSNEDRLGVLDCARRLMGEELPEFDAVVRKHVNAKYVNPKRSAKAVRREQKKAARWRKQHERQAK